MQQQMLQSKCHAKTHVDVTYDHHAKIGDHFFNFQNKLQSLLSKYPNSHTVSHESICITVVNFN